jgi:hypothetical protein
MVIRESEMGEQVRQTCHPSRLSFSLEEQVAMTCRPAGFEPHVSVARGFVAQEEEIFLPLSLCCRSRTIMCVGISGERECRFGEGVINRWFDV